MRIFLDTEFIERPGTIELISLGLVAEDGREYYAQSCEFDANQANPWVQAHVFPHLARCPLGRDLAAHRYDELCHRDCPWWTRAQIRDGVLAFVGADRPEWWTYYGAYDWTVFCWLFGAMVDLPAGWPMLAYDLRQWLDHLGLAQVKQPDEMPHQALSDAKWIAETFKAYAYLHQGAGR
jgi:hypothetical protein